MEKEKPILISVCKTKKGTHRVVASVFGLADTIVFESNTKGRVDVVADYLRDNQEVARAAMRASQTRVD